MSDIKISVVMGSFNQRDILPLVLDGFEKQNFPHDFFEVVVVDSTSTDGTADFLKQYSPSYSFVPIVKENKGKASARNEGVKCAKGDLIIITDSDMIPSPEFIATHFNAHQKTNVPTCFEGVTMNMTHLHWPPSKDYLYPYISREYQSGVRLGWFYFLTGNISFPKPLFLSYSGFDERFKSYGWEDLELGYRMSQDRVPLLFLKEAINYHYHVVTQGEEIVRNRSKGESAHILLQKHPRLKWFLGGNPLSLWVRRCISPEGRVVAFVYHSFFKSNTKLWNSFGFWFLKEYYYLSGFLGLDVPKHLDL